MTRSIDLNADLGEDESEEGIARDLAMMDIVSSCNIACGGHAGSMKNMERMLRAAKAKGVFAGAHPSYPDRENFGRVSMNISIAELRQSLNEQLKVANDAASKTGVSPSHLKPHGALYNDAQDDEALADLLTDLAAEEGVPLVGMAKSVLARKSVEKGIPFIAEAFIDRRYTDQARLVPRSETGAVISEEKQRLEQGLALASGESILSNSGQLISLHAQTLCLHSDSAGAVETARNMRDKLETNGIVIRFASIV